MLKKLLCLIILITITTNIYTQDHSKFTNIVYIHGFGEKKFPPAFEKKLNKFNDKRGKHLNIKTFRWAAQELDYRKLVYQWKIANKNCPVAGQRFYTDIIKTNEKSKKDYYIIAYSLGTKVFIESLKHVKIPLKYLKGIYFLGSALPNNLKINALKLPKSLLIQNFHSTFFDLVLKHSYYNAEGIRAGGEIGFTDKNRFINLRSVCTHAYKGGIFQRDYSELANAIGSLILYQQGYTDKTNKINWNIPIRVLSGKTFWNDILHLQNNKKIIIQQNINTGRYRAIQIFKDKKKRIAWDQHLVTILNHLNKTEK